MHIFLHIGTHKTGTTSLQAFLRSRAGELASSGILVPSAGTLNEGSGHHNLARQLSGDTRCDPALGGLKELVEELRNSSASRAVISSEGFFFLVERPKGLRLLEKTLRREGHSISWVVFVRRVDDYSESLYCTLWGCGVRPRFGYPGFVLSTLVQGKYTQRQKFGGTVYYFDFATFARRWRSLTPSSLRLLDYDRAVSDLGVLPCFLETIGAPETLHAGAGGDQPRLNARTEHVLRRYRKLLRPLLMARFHRSNLRTING